jgi:hypothetical protein
MRSSCCFLAASLACAGSLNDSALTGPLVYKRRMLTLSLSFFSSAASADGPSLKIAMYLPSTGS